MMTNATTSLISVLIPSYNCCSYLPKAIESVLAQNYENIEIIVVDDGSTDDTANVMENIKNSTFAKHGISIKYFQKEHSGISGTRNFAIQQAQGEYIAWLDADDYYLPEKLNTQIKYLHQNPNCQIVFTRYTNKIENPDLLANAKIQHELALEKTLKTYLSSALIHRNVYQKTGGYSTQLIVGEDSEMVSRIGNAGFSLKHCINQIFYVRLLHGNNSILTLSTKEQEKALQKAMMDNFLKRRLYNIVPKISVIIPVRNGEKYLKQAIESVKNQSLKESVEIIVVDDGSTDNSADIAEKSGCKVIKIAASGAIVARNTGLRKAKGDFVIFHDADDILTDNAFAAMYAEFVENQTLQVVFAKRQDFISPELSAEKQKLSVPKTEAYFGAMAGCALIRRNVFDTTGNFNEQLSGAGDAMDWMLKLDELKIETKKIDFVAVNRRLHNNNMGVTNKQQEYSDYLKILLQRRLKK